jgi:hypothetical protein
VKALSIRQPYVAAILAGRKSVEVRGGPTHHRGPLLLHASRRWGRRERAELERLRSRGVRLLEPEPEELGAIVGRATLVDCRPLEPGDLRRALVDDAEPGRFAWVLEDVRRLDPVPYRGHLFLFDVPDSALAGSAVPAASSPT